MSAHVALRRTTMSKQLWGALVRAVPGLTLGDVEELLPVLPRLVRGGAC